VLNRTRREDIVFRRPFALKGWAEPQPAGAYAVDVEEELIEGLSFPAYRRVSTMVTRASRAAPGRSSRRSLSSPVSWPRRRRRTARQFPGNTPGHPGEGGGMSTPRAAELIATALCGDIARLQRLLPIAGDPTAFAAPDDVTPMMAAASGGHEAVVELLMQRGSNPARRDAKGRSAAAYARAAGHTHLAARLDGVVDLDKTLR
jgi:hypothetical protein